MHMLIAYASECLDLFLLEVVRRGELRTSDFKQGYRNEYLLHRGCNKIAISAVVDGANDRIMFRRRPFEGLRLLSRPKSAFSDVE